ncbi:MAG: hypothetical protein ACR2QL_11500 [Woeseiaceae bacterium]
MTSLTAIFGSSAEKSDDDEKESEKLLNLYWNRAELKKEFAELGNEKFRLLERVAEQEGIAARAEQQLEQLENLLLDSASVYSTVTYFQLRSLNLHCQARVAKFAELLKQQREQRVHSQLVDDWNEARKVEATEIERQIGEQRIQAQMLEDRLQAERHRLATMSGFMRLFRGRSVTAALDKLAISIHELQENEARLLAQLEENLNRQPPDTQGLDIATKRTINLMILAYAQQQYLMLRDNDIADLAKEAGDKSVGATNYGDKASCEAILASVKERLAVLSRNTDFAEDLQNRAQLISERAEYRRPSDAVPTSASVSTVFEVLGDDTSKKFSLNLLGENYWNLNLVVSR